MRSFFKKYGFLFSISFTFFIIGLFYVTGLNALKIYPVIVNFLFFLIFFASLFAQKTVIQKIAELQEGALNNNVKIYTRNLTYLWCIFLFIQFLISMLTLFLDDKIWMIYNGFVSYILLGSFFAIEYMVRIILKRKKML